MAFDKETEFMLSKFSHELRNPLTTLFSTIQFLETQHPEVKNYKYWSCLSQDVEYMNLLIDELSDFTKSERLTLTTFDFRTFLEQISLSFAASICNSDVLFTSKIDSSIHQITGDKTKLQEVFFNLLKNAFEAAKPNHTISLIATQCDSQISVLIKDTGCGILKEQLPTIFEPFITYKKNGTGLGLSICRQIVLAHNGTISVTSSEGIGTTFTVLLNAENECD